MAGVMLGLFLAALDQTVVAIAMPRIIADLGGFDRYTWVTTSYLVASTTAVPIVGKLSDIYGRKGVFIAGVLIFLAGSLFSGFNQTMNQLIAARVVQGVGAGIILASSFIATADLFPPAERGKYQGIIVAVFGLSSIIGPTLGGFITDALSWHWVFFVNLPFGVPVAALLIRFFPKGRASDASHQLDYIGMATLILAVVPASGGSLLGGSAIRLVLATGDRRTGRRRGYDGGLHYGGNPGRQPGHATRYLSQPSR